MKYNPISKEFQDEAKRLGLTGWQYHRKLVEEGKLPNPTDLFNKEREKVIKSKIVKIEKNTEINVHKNWDTKIEQNMTK